MTSKVYAGKSGKSNAKRAAVAALGKSAKVDLDYRINEADGGFTWTAIGNGKPKRVKRDKGDIRGQPQAQRALKMAERKAGVTVQEGAEALGVKQDTFRGIMSRLHTSGCTFTKGKRDNENTYHHVAE